MKMLPLKKFSVLHFPFHQYAKNIWLVSLLFCLVVFVSHLYILFCGLRKCPKFIGSGHTF